MDKLITLLRELADSPRPDGYGYLSDGVSGERDPLIEEIIALADTFLIKCGQPNFASHTVLGEAGFPVHRGEADSFGWLSGVISTRKGMIVYG